MGDTSIEWTDKSWNPTRGCSRVSPGCTNCYAERFAIRFAGPGQAYHGLVKSTPSGPRWTGTVRLAPEMLEQPLHWRKPARIFVNSMSDLFHEQLPDGDILQVLDVIRQCAANALPGADGPDHIFQVLTKRATRMRSFISRLRFDGSDGGRGLYLWDRTTTWASCLTNLHLGVSVEDRARLTRIDELRATPARVRFLSIEPLLEDLGVLELRDIHWVIVGGESGHGARPMHPDWARAVRDQCAAAGVAFFFKQWGAWRPEYQGATTHERIVGPYYERPWAIAGDQTVMFKLDPKRAGRHLDGRTWDEFPEAR